jgi:hypothetical protein
MSVPPAPATEWAEPTRYLPPPEPRLRAAAHSFRGQDDIDGVVRLSVDYLAPALRQV